MTLTVGDILIGDCCNCFNNVELEFRYKENQNVFVFRCEHCGMYNYLNKTKTENMILFNDEITAYQETITECLKKFRPLKIGGCFEATRWLLRKHKELKEITVDVRNKKSNIPHCVAVTPRGNIIDTQWWQFRLIYSHLEECDKTVWLFTTAQHEAMLPRYKVGD